MKSGTTTMANKKEREFIELMEANSGIIIKIIHLYADHPTDRQDLQQEIMIQAWRSFESFEGRSKFSTWLYKISLNTALSYIKAEKRRKEKLATVELRETHDESKTELSDMLLSAIKMLPDVSRMIITLHLDGYANHEIADITGISANHIGVKLHRIKSQLISLLKSKS